MACNGQGKEAFWQSLREGKPGYKSITLFDTSHLSAHVAGEISDFDPTKYMGTKGLRSLDRSTKLLCSAARLAIDDSGFKITEENTDDVGVAVGTTLGSLNSIVDFDLTTLREGPRYTNPALFPNTVLNSPASQVSIWNNIQGFNTTISTGFTASLDAMWNAVDSIQMDQVKLVYTGGVEDLCLPTFAGFHAVQYLSGSKSGEAFINCPFDKRRNGITYSESACLIAFEDLEHAQKRNAKIYGEVIGLGYYFDTLRKYKFNPNGTGMKEAMREALESAELTPKDIDYICANANSTKDADKIETAAIKEVFGDHSRKIPVSAPKSIYGECYSVSGAMALAACVGALHEGFIPPTANYVENDPLCDLDYVPNESRSKKINTILINNFSPQGANACMIIRRFEG